TGNERTDCGCNAGEGAGDGVSNAGEVRPIVISEPDSHWVLAKPYPGWNRHFIVKWPAKLMKKRRGLWRFVGAGRGGRTPMTRRSADFESAASASSAIPAHFN